MKQRTSCRARGVHKARIVMADTSSSITLSRGEQQTSSFFPPAPMKIEGAHLEQSWKTWIQKFELFLLASRAENLPEKTKVAMFLSALGDEGLHIYNTFEFDSDDDRNVYETVKQKFTEYCLPHKNVVFERYNFWKATQAVGESIDSFVTTLRLRAKTCEFEQHVDSMIRDRIVLGCNDARLQERLLREPDLTLVKAINICRATEATKEQLRTIKSATATETVSEINTRATDKRTQQKSTVCQKCGGSHPPRSCPAYGKRCNKCSGISHFAKMCYKNRAEVSTQQS